MFMYRNLDLTFNTYSIVIEKSITFNKDMKV